MKRPPFLFAAMISVLAAACDSGSTPPKPITPGGDCTSNDDCPDMVCAHGICMTPDDPCADKTCPDGVLCRDGECQESNECGSETCTDKQVCKDDKCIDLCGTKTCKDSEVCVSNQCKPLCGDRACNDDEVCVNDQCREAGECGNIKCNDDQICIDETCKPKGDCGGVKCDDDQTCHNDTCHDSGECGGLSCTENEVCHENTCYPKGDCGEIECINGQICDHNYNICRDPGDCDGVKCNDSEYCYLNMYCEQKVQCGETLCDGGFECIDDVCTPTFCIDGSNLCGTNCCTNEQFCGNRTVCCEKSEACGNDCCDSSQVCENETCHIKCDEGISRCALADGSEVCCAEGEICISNQCYKPTVSCVDDYMCEIDEYCESTEKICLPRPKTPVCESKPTGGEVQPTLVWYWGAGELAPAANEYPNHVQVMSSPMVADIDGDGTAEVVFNSFSSSGYNGNGILRILDGKTGKLKAFSNASPYTDGGSQVAIGDVIPSNPGLEIATCVKYNGSYKLALFNNKAELIWVSKNGSYHECGQSGPGIADFNGDGLPEVYGRFNVLNGQTGELIARKTHPQCDDSKIQHNMCDYPVAADIDNDGIQELVGGTIAFKVDFENKTLNPVFDRSDLTIGYPAIGDLDLDGTPEIAIVQSTANTVMALRHDGTNYWDKPVPLSAASGGPPTIANLDNTPNPEITFAGKYAYVALNYDGSVKWTRSTHDYSSAKTGSSVFDFDGDGTADVVYADEYFLRVYDGNSGDTVYCKCNTSGTHWEYPVIADVDNDDHAEIVVSSNSSMIGGCPTSLSTTEGFDACVEKIMKSTDATDRAATHGVRVFASPNKDWVNTRKIYNQHAYSITNISDNGTIPRKVRNNWQANSLNNFRLNVQPGASYLPDLEIKTVSSPRTCTELTPIYFDVVNVGWAAAEPGIKVHLFASDKPNGEYTEVGSVQTTKLLRASESESLKFDYPYDGIGSSVRYLVLKFDDSMPTECHSDNNSASYTLNCTVIN